MTEGQQQYKTLEQVSYGCTVHGVTVSAYFTVKLHSSG